MVRPSVLLCLLSLFLVVVCYVLKVLVIGWGGSRKPIFDENKAFVGSIAFFHPFCNDCGGGERVLWFFVLAVQKKFPKASIFVYSCDPSSPEAIIKKAIERFNVPLDRQRVTFLYMAQKRWILPSSWPYFTLVGQSFGSIILGMEAFRLLKPDILIETTGFSFVSWLSKIVGCKGSISYVHYPTISTDMISRVASRKASYNNPSFVGKSHVLSMAKVMYYRSYAWFYGLSSKGVNYAMANSKWTYRHLVEIWKLNESRLAVVYPPCSPHYFATEPLNSSGRKKQIISVAQFRPEKNHKLQLHAYERFLRIGGGDSNEYTLIIAGSVRSSEDLSLVESLRVMARDLGVAEHVEFRTDLTWSGMVALLTESAIGLHTMDTEHFGIGIVEMMAAGLVVIAHNSGGPKSDIMVPYRGHIVGFLAKEPEEYAAIMHKVVDMNPKEVKALRSNARQSVLTRFTDAVFISNVEATVDKVISEL